MLDIRLDKTSDLPLYAQIRDGVKKAVLDGGLSLGDRLPPVADFARQLDVTATTIRRALEDLTAEGLVESHVGRGTFISRPLQDDSFRNTAIHGERTRRMGVSKNLSELLSLADRDGIIRFTKGVPNTEIIPDDLLKTHAAHILGRGEYQFRTYGDPAGLPELRRAIAGRYQKQGLDISAGNILITSGSQQALALLAQDASDAGGRFLCETPSYSGVPNAFGAFGFWTETVNRDAEGPEISFLNSLPEKDSYLFYLCPFLHNPMGTNITEQRLNDIRQWSGKRDVLILSDEIYRDLSYSGELQPSLFGAFPSGKVVSISSLSKSLMTGLRLGWLIAPPEQISRLIILKKAMDITCPPLMQGLALSLLESGDYDRHLDRIRVLYRRQKDVLTEAMSQYMPADVQWSDPQGGFQLWAELPQRFSSISLFLKAVDRGVAFMPGPLQDVNNRYGHAFRMCFGNLSEEDIREGVKRLADVIGEMLAEGPGGTGVGGFV